MKIVKYENVNISNVRQSNNPKYPNTVYFTVTGQAGEFKLSTENVPAEHLESAQGLPMDIEGKETGSLYQNSQNLRLEVTELKVSSAGLAKIKQFQAS